MTSGPYLEVIRGKCYGKYPRSKAFLENAGSFIEKYLMCELLPEDIQKFELALNNSEWFSKTHNRQKDKFGLNVYPLTDYSNYYDCLDRYIDNRMSKEEILKMHKCINANIFLDQAVANRRFDRLTGVIENIIDDIPGYN